MKTLITTLTLILSGTLMCLAQCDKKSTFTSSHTVYLASNGSVERSVDENVQIDMDKSDIVITHGADNEKMTGTLKSLTCDWKTPFKEGKTTLAAILEDKSGDQRNATIIIEGKNGKVTFTLEVEGMQGRKIQVTADRFEERG